MDETNKSFKAPEPALLEQPRVLLIDDDILITSSLEYILKQHFHITVINHPNQLIEAMNRNESFDLALIDLGLPPLPHQPDEGFKLIEKLIQYNAQIRIVVLSGQNDEKNIRYALSLGAADFIAKPAEPKAILSTLKKQWDSYHHEREHQSQNNWIIGQSSAIFQVKKQIEQFAPLPFPVLIEGESGTGKELVAKGLHQHSQRKQEAFLAINCAALNAELLESQLFGHKKGAFSGAHADHIGFFEKAKNGTLFLDEIGEMALSLQAKLLRVLENGEFYRVGCTQVRHATCRLIAATNRSLLAEIKQHQFRADLYHRLSTLTMNLPPLREREQDWEILFQHYAEQMAHHFGSITLTQEAKTFLAQYRFPGNVRELKNIVIRLGSKYPHQPITHAQLIHEIEPYLLSHPPELTNTEIINEEAIRMHIESGGLDLNHLLCDLEKRCIQLALEMNHQNLSGAARDLHINRSTLHSRIQKYEEPNVK